MEIPRGLTMAHVTLNPLSIQCAKGLFSHLIACLPVVGPDIRTVQSGSSNYHTGTLLHHRAYRYTLQLRY